MVIFKHFNTFEILSLVPARHSIRNTVLGWDRTVWIFSCPDLLWNINCQVVQKNNNKSKTFGLLSELITFHLELEW